MYIITVAEVPLITFQHKVSFPLLSCIAKSVPFHEATQGFFYAAHEAVIHCAEMRVPPLEIAFAQMTRRSVLVAVLALRIFSYACKSLRVITMFRGERRVNLSIFQRFSRERLHLNARIHGDVGATLFLLLRVGPTYVRR